MTKAWTEADLQTHIADIIPESLNLDYKAAASLAKSDEKRREVTKDVSAMANSDGGIIIYGIAEDKTVMPPVPSRIDPVDASIISKEWLEQVISTIRPKVDGIIIHPVQLTSASHHFAYVVEIPQSTTAHQAGDKRYYKRFNFESTAMDDYQIRDVMSRGQHPKLELNFYRQKTQQGYRLIVTATNKGNVYAQYVTTFIYFQPEILDPTERGPFVSYQNNEKYLCLRKTNFVQRQNYYTPFLPGTRFSWESIDLNPKLDSPLNQTSLIWWTIHADNAPVAQGEILLKDIGEPDPNLLYSDVDSIIER